jgi:serine/threonine protein kinase
MNDPVPPLGPSVSHSLELDAILRVALAKDPKQRYASADALSADLQALGVPVTPWDDHTFQADDNSTASLRTASEVYEIQEDGLNSRTVYDVPLQVGSEPAADLTGVSVLPGRLRRWRLQESWNAVELESTTPYN